MIIAPFLRLARRLKLNTTFEMDDSRIQGIVIHGERLAICLKSICWRDLVSMSVSTKDRVHNQFCREPDAGKPHVRFCAGVRLVRGVSTHQVRGPFLLWEVYELYCGHTPYSQMGQDEIEQFVSVQKLPLPADMNEELKILISALTYPDITNRKNRANPNRRWGYEEILKWCVGIKQPIPGEIAGTTAVSGDIKPYKFLGETYTRKEELISALANNWNEGKKQLCRGLLSAYFKSFDAEINRPF